MSPSRVAAVVEVVNVPPSSNDDDATHLPKMRERPMAILKRYGKVRLEHKG